MTIKCSLTNPNEPSFKWLGDWNAYPPFPLLELKKSTIFSDPTLSVFRNFLVLNCTFSSQAESGWLAKWIGMTLIIYSSTAYFVSEVAAAQINGLAVNFAQVFQRKFSVECLIHSLGWIAVAKFAIKMLLLTN